MDKSYVRIASIEILFLGEDEIDRKNGGEGGIVNGKRELL